MAKRILITGGAGFIGNNVARHLTANGYTVIALDDLSLGRASNLPADILLQTGDVADECVWDAVPDVDSVIHLAGPSSTPMFSSDLIGSFHSKIIGFLRMLEFARRKECRRIIYASSALVYGNAPIPLREEGPLDISNFYATAKYCLESIAHTYSLKYGMDIIGVRLMSIYGLREDHKKELANLVSQFIWDIERGRKPTVYGNGTQTRDFTNVQDVARAFQLILEHSQPLGSMILNVGTGKAVSLNDLIGVLSELMGVSVQPSYIPNPSGENYNRRQVASLERITQILGYRPSVSLQDGINEILTFRRQGSNSDKDNSDDRRVIV